jgi:hypothetical protein
MKLLSQIAVADKESDSCLKLLYLRHSLVALVVNRKVR